MKNTKECLLKVKPGDPLKSREITKLVIIRVVPRKQSFVPCGLVAVFLLYLRRILWMLENYIKKLMN